jgi:hypothetical protein
MPFFGQEGEEKVMIGLRSKSIQFFISGLSFIMLSIFLSTILIYSLRFIPTALILSGIIPFIFIIYGSVYLIIGLSGLRIRNFIGSISDPMEVHTGIPDYINYVSQLSIIYRPKRLRVLRLQVLIFVVVLLYLWLTSYLISPGLLEIQSFVVFTAISILATLILLIVIIDSYWNSLKVDQAFVEMRRLFRKKTLDTKNVKLVAITDPWDDRILHPLLQCSIFFLTDVDFLYLPIPKSSPDQAYFSPDGSRFIHFTSIDQFKNYLSNFLNVEVKDMRSNKTHSNQEIFK